MKSKTRSANGMPQRTHAGKRRLGSWALAKHCVRGRSQDMKTVKFFFCQSIPKLEMDPSATFAAQSPEAQRPDAVNPNP